MDSIVDPKDFPASDKCTYLNAANVALMYQGAEKAIIEWQKDLVKMARKLKAAQVMVSWRKDFVRFSPHLYNQPADIQQALDRIEEIL